MTYEEIQIILSQISDPAEKLEFVMDLGRTLAAVPNGAPATEIKGCASRVEIYRDENNNYYGSADSALVRGVLAVLLSAAAGKSPDEIRRMDLGREFESLNLSLGAGRMNGVNGIIDFLTQE